jgi:hypothetical protein
MKQTLVAGGGDFLYYPLERWQFWGGLGLEYARGLSIEITLDGQTVPTTSSNFSNYVKASLALGWDISIGNQFFVTPFGRGGMIFSTKPNMTIYEIDLAVGYRL